MNGEPTSLFELPNGWVWTRLGEIALEPQYGWTTSAADTGGLRLLRTTDITSGYVDWGSVPFCQDEPPNVAKYLLHDRDIVISRAGSVGYSYLIRNPPEAVFASYLIRFKPLIDAAYVGLFLKSPVYWEAILEKSIGIALANVNASKLKQIHVPLPPLLEQHRIVARIEELFARLDAGVESLTKIKTHLKRYRQAVLKHAFEGKLTEEWRQAHKHELEPASVLLERIKLERQKTAKGKYTQPAPLDASSLPELPPLWAWARIAEICTLINGRAFKPLEWSTHGLPIIRIQNLNDPDANFNYCDFEIDDRFVVYDGQLLFAWSGTPETSFGAHIWNKGKAVLNQHIFKVMTNEDHIDKPFLMHVLNQNVAAFIRKAHGTAGLAHITKGKFEESPISLPPLLEQHHIVEEIECRFSIADEIEKTVDHSLKQGERLRQSILKKALEGKLVPQDPNDEPAEKLLERIKAERAQRLAETKATGKNKRRTHAKRRRLI